MNALVLGSGSWGTALATVLARNENKVTLWTRSEKEAKSLQQSRVNKKYHPGIELSSNICFTHHVKTLSKFDIVVYACPSYALNHVLKKMNYSAGNSIPFVSTAKGINNTSLLTIGETLKHKLGEKWFKQSYAVLSGPSFAHDVVRYKPTAVTVAANTTACAQTVQQAFHHSTFHTYTSNDVIGVEIAGALKNVIAIAAGACDGLDLGPSARSALITRGLAEIIAIGVAKGAKKETFAGLSGLGDLLLTCTSDLSRNKRVGKMLAQGQSLREMIKNLGQVAEGIRTTKSAYMLLKKLNLKSVIIDQIYQGLYQNKPLDNALSSILNQAPGNE